MGGVCPRHLTVGELWVGTPPFGEFAGVFEALFVPLSAVTDQCGNPVEPPSPPRTDGQGSQDSDAAKNPIDMV